MFSQKRGRDDDSAPPDTKRNRQKDRHVVLRQRQTAGADSVIIWVYYPVSPFAGLEAIMQKQTERTGTLNLIR